MFRPAMIRIRNISKGPLNFSRLLPKCLFAIQEHNPELYLLFGLGTTTLPDTIVLPQPEGFREGRSTIIYAPNTQASMSY